MQEDKYDISIVGGGIVGLATAYKLQLEYPKLKIIVIEKERELAFHQTGRNSGVIHSGLYYQPGSSRARNCLNGRKQLIAFAREHNIKYDLCGKIVLATNQKDIQILESLKKNGEENGLTGLKLINKQEIKKIEPYVVGDAALFVPHAGIIDYKAITNKFAELIVKINPNSKILTNCKVLNIKNDRLLSTNGEIVSLHTIFCGGLFSDRLARKDNLKSKMKILGFRGDYYELREGSRKKVNNLIYPVPNPEFPFLGVHLTRMIDGRVECGPNAVLTFKREGYSKTAFSIRDSIDFLTFLGTWKLFINHWKFGLNEYRRAFSKRLFLRELRKMIPSLKINDIKSGKSGVRAMALSSGGEIIDDFQIIDHRNNIHVLNAPSPAATSCLAIGDEILNHTKKSFNINR